MRNAKKSGDSSLAMNVLRKNRRKQGLCAQCGNLSTTYLCDKCTERRNALKEVRETQRLSQNLCIRCGKAPIFEDKKCICKRCNNIYPNLPIRKLRSWEVKNRKLYQVMMEKPCTTLELADAADVSQRSVNRWIFNNSTPKFDTACKAAKYLNRDVGELFVGIRVIK